MNSSATRSPAARIVWLFCFCAAATGVIHADDVASSMQLGGEALAKGDWQAAHQHFTAASQAAPNTALPWLGLAETAERQGDFLAALELARKASTQPDAGIASRLAVGRLQTRIGAVSEALATYEALRQAAPKEPLAYLLPALILRDVQQGSTAIELLQLALSRGLRDVELSEQLAFLQLAAGDAQAARATAKAALAAHPEHPGLNLALGLALAGDAEQSGRAIPLLEKALAAGVANPGRVHLELATLLLQAGRTDEALNHLRQAQTLLPDSPELHYRLANALRRAGDRDAAAQALERFRTLSEQSQNDDRASKELGIELNRIQGLAANNQLTEAASALDQLLTQHSKEHRALALRAKVRFSLQRRDEATRDIAEAARLAPQELEYHYLEGFFLMHLDQAVAAEAALRRAIALDDSVARSHQLLGTALQRQNRLDEAREHLERALALGGDNPQLRRQLESLGSQP